MESELTNKDFKQRRLSKDDGSFVTQSMQEISNMDGLRKMELDDRVRVDGIGTGFIHKIRRDAREVLIYIIFLDNSNTTPTGLYYAHRHELHKMN